MVRHRTPRLDDSSWSASVRTTFLLVVPAILLSCPEALRAATTLRATVMDAGGGQLIGSAHRIAATFGQPIFGRSGTGLTSLGAGFWGANPLTDASNQQLPTRPPVTKLQQNYPNPFNPVTFLRFQLAQDCDLVKLTLYDSGGRRIKSLLRAPLGAGYYSFVWNGDDENGSAVSSGIYFYVLETPDFYSARRMVLVR